MRPAEPLDPDLTTIELSHGPVFHTDTGSGRALVGVHGAPASSRDFRWLDAALDGRLRFLRLDLPGFGRSLWRTTVGTTISDLGAVVAEFCEAAELEDAIVLGHSIGGAIAIDAATRTSRIAGLALVNSAGPKNHRGNFPRAYRALLRVKDLHPMARRVALALTTPIARAVGFSKRVTDDEYVWAAQLCGYFDPELLGRQLASLDKPALVAWARDDPSVEAAVTEAILSRVPNAERVPFDTGGHNLQSTRAIELADALVAWQATLD